MLIQLVVLVLFSVGAAQTPETGEIYLSTCPQISVQTPAGIINPGNPVRYQVIVNGSVLGRPKYNWSVSKGKIVSGQGTHTMDAVFSGYPRIKATVKVTGLAPGCSYSASAVYEYTIEPGPIKLGKTAGPGYVIKRGCWPK